MAGALRVDRDFADGPATWSATYGARAAWRPDARAAFVAEAWRGTADPPAGATGDALDVEALGLHLELTPWADRGWPVDPAFGFGLERVDADDGMDRGTAFVSMLGIRAGAGRLAFHAQTRNHLLSVEEEPVDGVETGRDSQLWEARIGLGIVLGSP